MIDRKRDDGLVRKRWSYNSFDDSVGRPTAPLRILHLLVVLWSLFLAWEVTLWEGCDGYLFQDGIGTLDAGICEFACVMGPKRG
jgi:hypothetical protein